MNRAHRVAAVFIAGSIVAAAVPVAAYLDPGTGSLFLQGLIAAGAAAIAAVGMYWRSLVGFFRKRSGTGPAAGSQGDDRAG